VLIKRRRALALRPGRRIVRRPAARETVLGPAGRRTGWRALVLVLAVAVSAACSGDGPAPGPAGSPPVPAPSTSAAPTGSAARTAPATSDRDWPAYHGSADRAGVAPTMPAVSRLRVLTAIRLDGAVYASPIVAGGLTVVATENDTVYAFDSAYRQVWRQHVGEPSPAAERPCGNIDPLGITGTPVYDATTGLVYVAPEYGGPPRHELVALDLRTGAVRWRRGIDLAGTETKAMQERGALAVTGGRVWVPFGGMAGDCGGYKGRVVGVRLDGTGDPVGYTVPTAREAGIWTPPGPVVDSAGDLYVAVGNGESGVGDPYDHSDSVLRIGPDGRLRDSFSPTTWPTDNDADLDLGSQGPTLVGPWVFAAGKSGTGYVLRRDHLGGIGGQVSQAEVCRSFGGTAVSAGIVYVPCTDGIRAVGIDGSGRLSVRWHADGALAGSPVVGGGRVWTLDQSGGVLHALDPATGATREHVAVGATSRFATPAITGRDVLIPTLTGLTVVRTS
jgi:outer membrane protein assembly factor BamB